MNRDLFGSSPELVVPTDTKNAAGGAAYRMSPKEVLATIACTSFFGNTYYAKAEDQLAMIIEAAEKCEPAFVAKVACYARESGLMKDTPAVLCAYLFGKRALDTQTFNTVIDNVKMLSNFVRAVRSGKFGRRSLGSAGKRMIAQWLSRRSVDYLWRQSIAKDPSLADIIKLAHPSPVSFERDLGFAALDAQRVALYRHLIGKPVDRERLPQLVQDTLAFRERAHSTMSISQPVPDVPFNMVDSVPMTPVQWAQLIERGGYQFVRMNLQTANRQGVLKLPHMVEMIAAKLENEQAIREARQFPYQLLTTLASIHADMSMPARIKNAVFKALDLSMANVPALSGRVEIAIDTSGSMGSHVTDHITYREVAALFAAALLRTNPNAGVMLFDTSVVRGQFNPFDSVSTIAMQLAQRQGGDTDCSAPIRLLNSVKADVDTLIFISDNESWADGARTHFGQQTGSLVEWQQLKKRCPNAKQVRINISPNATNQMPDRDDTLRVAGFSDSVFTAIANWAAGKNWVEQIEAFA